MKHSPRFIPWHFSFFQHLPSIVTSFWLAPTIILLICSLILDWNHYCLLDSACCMHLPLKMSNTELIFSSSFRHFPKAHGPPLRTSSAQGGLEPQDPAPLAITWWIQSSEDVELWWAPGYSGWTGGRYKRKLPSSVMCTEIQRNLVCEKKHKRDKERQRCVTTQTRDNLTLLRSSLWCSAHSRFLSPWGSATLSVVKFWDLILFFIITSA